jgi:hypothetical protein
MVEHQPGFARRVGVTASEGAGQLDQQGYHVEVRTDRLRVTR